MASPNRIPTPLRVRCRRFCRHVLPVLVFGGGVVAAGLLWHSQASVTHAVGEVEAVRVNVVAASEGLLLELDSGRPWALFDAVDPGDTLARLDDRLLLLQLATLRGELERLRVEVDAQAGRLVFDQSTLQLDHVRELTRLTWTLQQRRLLVLDRRVLLETDAVELQRSIATVSRVEHLLKGQHVTELEVVNAQLLRDAIAARIAANKAALAEEERQVQQAQAGIDAKLPVMPPDVEQLLAPFRAAINTQEAKINELRHVSESLTIKAPFRGTIAAIFAWPGQRLRVGDPIVSVAATDGRYIVSYVREGAPRPAAGDRVLVKSRQQPRVTVESLVERIGPQVEPIPLHQLRDPRLPEWGFPVRIALPSPHNWVPGELVEIAH